MRSRHKYLMISLAMILALAGCRNSDTAEPGSRITDEQLLDINRELAIKERERIESYIERKGLNMQLSRQGFWYSIVEEGSKVRLKANSHIGLSYKCSLLDGTLCYSSDEDGILKVTIGKTDIPSGLDAALRLFANGTEAIVILPSNLAFGLVGDGKRIPSKAALIYHLKVSLL